MSLDINVYTVLNAAGIDPVRGWLPEEQAYPCAVVRYIADRPYNTLKAELSALNEIIAVDCWASDLEAAEALRDQVKAAIKAAVAAKTLSAVRLALRTLHEPKTQTFRFTIEYSVRGQ